MDKFMVFLTIMFVSALSFANEELLTLVGESLSGEKCTYQVMKMNDWDGQVVIYLNGAQGNFRVELNSEAYEKGLILSQFESNIDFTFVDGVLNVLVPGLDGDADRLIKITTHEENILKPLLAVASQAPEEYSCWFN